MMHWSQYIPPILAAAGLLLLTAAAADHVFFWDTIQFAGKHGLYYFDNQFGQLLLPVELDSGHPPTFGLALAFAWTIAGKSLSVSHWSMLPFLLLTVGAAWQLGRYWSPRQPWLGLALVMLNPVWLGQAVLVSPDLWLTASFLWSLAGVLEKNNNWLLVGVIGLALISTRGMMTGLALYVFDLYTRSQNSGWKWSLIWRRVLPFLPGGLLGLAYLVWHYRQAGWIGYHAESSWAPSFERVDLIGFFRNAAILGWRLLDHGNVFIWLPLVILGVRYRATLRKQPQVQRAFVLVLILTIFLVPTFLFYAGLQGHRYLLPLYFGGSFLLVAIVQCLPWQIRTKDRLAILVTAGLFLGNFWVYPPHIAQAWDATLAHWPYYRVRSQALADIKRMGIPLESIGTAFPEIGPQRYKDLSDNPHGMIPKDLDRQQYILYSNLMNDFTDRERAQLVSDWVPLQKWQDRWIAIVLYRAPQNE